MSLSSKDVDFCTPLRSKMCNQKEVFIECFALILVSIDLIHLREKLNVLQL